MNDGKVTNPRARQIVTRRTLVASYQRDPAWKKMKEEHAWTPEAGCIYCHRKHKQPWVNAKGKRVIVHLTINHTSRHLYASKTLYLTWDPRYMEITCLSCNRMYEKGMKPCPECLKKGKMHYILDREQECSTCYYEKHPEELAVAVAEREAFEQRVKQANADRAARQRKKASAFPCRFHGTHQWCRVQGIACTFSKSKALQPPPVGCGKAQAKVKFLKVKK